MARKRGYCTDSVCTAIVSLDHLPFLYQAVEFRVSDLIFFSVYVFYGGKEGI